MLLEGCKRTVKAVIPTVLLTNPSPLDWQEWEKHLASHPDRALADYVVHGLHDGFRIGFDYTNHRTKRVEQIGYATPRCDSRLPSKGMFRRQDSRPSPTGFLPTYAG